MPRFRESVPPSGAATCSQGSNTRALSAPPERAAPPCETARSDRRAARPSHANFGSPSARSRRRSNAGPYPRLTSSSEAHAERPDAGPGRSLVVSVATRSGCSTSTGRDPIRSRRGSQFRSDRDPAGSEIKWTSCRCRDHRRRSLMDSVDDLGVVDPAQVRGGDAQVGMAEWRWMTTRGTPSRDISAACAWLS